MSCLHVKDNFYSRAVYTMDHEVVPRPSKRCDWTLKSSRDDLGLHQGKNGRVTTEVEVHKFFFKPTLSTAMVQRDFRWDKQKRWSRKNSKGPCQKKCRFNDFFPDLVNDSTFWCMVILHGPHLVYT
jgi:hypothetical protein